MARKHRGRRILIFLMVLATAAIAASYIAAQKLQSEMEQALGPNSEVAAIHLRWNGIEIEGLRIKAVRNWPAEDELRAKRIRVTPALRSLLSKQIVVSDIDIDGAYVSVLRSADGRLHVLPSLLEKPKKANSGEMPNIRIDRITLDNAAVTFYDGSVLKTRLVNRIEKLEARIDDIQLPSLKGKTSFEVEGMLKGVKHDGTISIKGWADISSMDSEVRTRLRGVDLLALKPYLVKAADTGVKQGTLDLDLDSRVQDKHLKAPGTVTLHDLELDQSDGFMGFSRRATVSLMQDRKKEIVVRFELGGNVDDPAFSLNENIASRFGASMADTLGISVEGVTKGARAVGSTLGSAAEGAGRAIKDLFGGKTQ